MNLVANLAGADLWIVLAVVLVIFGGSQLPKLARSLGSASHEFRKGMEEGAAAKESEGSNDKPGG
ncbi:MAG TPA: twin-arginine translocase TatA/TatE family subunit [Acidimicrobiales bacterium]|jgi:sec-independent protein translocase protein TatA|nr:twin-arginine translocase TatA/TatE family subunit [Acidimicrobiales bacterium]